MVFKKRTFASTLAEIHKEFAAYVLTDELVIRVEQKFLEEIHDMLRLLVAASGLPVEEKE